MSLSVDLVSLRGRLVVRVSRYLFFAAIVPVSFVVWQYHLGTMPAVTPPTVLVCVAGLGWAGFGPASSSGRSILMLAALAVVATHSAVVAGFAPATVGGAAGLCLLAACLWPPRVAQAVSVICPLVLVGIGALHAAGKLHMADSIVDLQRSINWWRAASTLVTLTLPPVIAIVMHIDSLDLSVRRRSELVEQALREERRRHASVQAHALAEAERRRAQGLAALGRLGGGFAHEINNKLQAIRGELDLLQMRPAGREALPPAALTDMLEAVDGAAAVMRRLLTLSGRDLEASRKPVELHAFLHVARRQLAQIGGLSVQTESEPGLVASADAPSLHAVLLNLGLNARDAMGGRGTLKLRARPATGDERDDTGCAVAVDVTDTGVGMDATTLARLFEPLFTTKGSAGTGLGLTGVRRVLESSGGRLRVASTLGRGTTFTICLPAGESAAPPAYEDALPSRAVAVGGRVLVVDDDDAVRRAFRCALERHGYQVFCAQDVAGAIDLVAAHSVDLVWMDAVMPGRPTRDLIAELRRVQPRARLVVCSGHVEEELLRRDLRAGEIEFVAKPCCLAVLLEHAHRAGARSRSAS